MAAEITTITITEGDITNLTVDNDISILTVQDADVTVISSASATINLANASYANTPPEDIARTASIGVLNVAARADHVHSIANTLLDGGNY